VKHENFGEIKKGAEMGVLGLNFAEKKNHKMRET
jgi:hypothetical protein